MRLWVPSGSLSLLERIVVRAALAYCASYSTDFTFSCQKCGPTRGRHVPGCATCGLGSSRLAWIAALWPRLMLRVWLVVGRSLAYGAWPSAAHVAANGRRFDAAQRERKREVARQQRVDMARGVRS